MTIHDAEQGWNEYMEYVPYLKLFSDGLPESDTIIRGWLAGWLAWICTPISTPDYRLRIRQIGPN